MSEGKHMTIEQLRELIESRELSTVEVNRIIREVHRIIREFSELDHN